jgi:hypothetical protein
VDYSDVSRDSAPPIHGRWSLTPGEKHTDGIKERRKVLLGVPKLEARARQYQLHFREFINNPFVNVAQVCGVISVEALERGFYSLAVQDVHGNAPDVCFRNKTLNTVRGMEAATPDTDWVSFRY